MDINQKLTLILSVVSVFLTGVYVILTLIIVLQTKKSLNETKIQSEKARVASEKQSREAIAAIHEQILASEKQSQSAIDAVHEEILASEKQAREALYNQHKPVIVPVASPTSPDGTTFIMNVLNKGTGVASNAWGIITFKGLPITYCSVKAYFLVTDELTSLAFSSNSAALYPFNVFENQNIFPKAFTDDIDTSVRLTLTYNDIFDNKYLLIFDRSDEFEWRQVTFQGVKKRLDEITVKRKNPSTLNS